MAAIYADPALAARFRRGWFISFDPGVGHPAVAIWLHGELLHASRVKVPGALKKLDRVERCRQIAKLVRAHVRGFINDYLKTARPSGDNLRDLQTFSGELAGVMMEYPQWYSESRGKSKVDPNKLAPMATLDGCVATELDVQTWSYLPGEWCGGIPKSTTGDPWNCPRGQVLRSRLEPAEVARIEQSHDAIDAAGVGLKALGRLESKLFGSS